MFSKFSSPTSRRVMLAASATTLAATAMVAGSTGAQASAGAPPASVARAASTTTFTLPANGSSGLMPTWVFSNTHLCIFNYGTSNGRAEVKASIGGAAAEYIDAAPFQLSCIDRWWAGNPVRVTNVASAPLAVSGS
jgi:hypothetical protein